MCNFFCHPRAMVDVHLISQAGCAAEDDLVSAEGFVGFKTGWWEVSGERHI